MMAQIWSRAGPRTATRRRAACPPDQHRSRRPPRRRVVSGRCCAPATAWGTAGGGLLSDSAPGRADEQRQRGGPAALRPPSRRERATRPTVSGASPTGSTLAADRAVAVVSCPARRRGGARPQRPLGKWPPRTSVGEEGAGGAGVGGEVARGEDQGGKRGEANHRVGGVRDRRTAVGDGHPTPRDCTIGGGRHTGMDDALAVAAPPPQPPVRVAERQGNKNEKTKGGRGWGGGATTTAGQRGVVVGAQAHTA